MARKAKDVEPAPAAAPPQRVVAVETKAGAEAARLANAEKKTTVTFNIPTPQKGCLVLDANAFIKGLDGYVSQADVLITTPQVVGEIKDRHSRELLQRLPVELIVLDPTPESVNKVVDAASRTGDLGALSRTDIRLCALGLDIGAQLQALRPAIASARVDVNPDEIEVVGDEQSDDDGADAEADAAANDDEDDKADDDDGAANDDEDDDAAMPGWGGSDDEGEWINESNVDRVRGFHVRAEGEEAATIAGAFAGADDDGDIIGDRYEKGFATATSDFPMQNVLLHLGVPIVGPTGMQIRELRTWLLRCHACFTLVTDTTRQFCPDCGSGNTLKRVSYTVTETGERKLFINFKHHISTRGNVYSLPKPRGGRNGTNRTLVLREDQLANCGRKTEAQKRKAALAAAQAAGAGGPEDDLKGFGEQNYRSRGRTMLKDQSSYHKYNVNEKKKLRAARRK